MSFVETPSGTTAALVPESKDSARGTASTREISIAHSPDSPSMLGLPPMLDNVDR